MICRDILHHISIPGELGNRRKHPFVIWTALVELVTCMQGWRQRVSAQELIGDMLWLPKSLDTSCQFSLTLALTLTLFIAKTSGAKKHPHVIIASTNYDLKSFM